MLKQTLFILTLLTLAACNNSPYRQDFVVFEQDTRESKNNNGFKPTSTQIDKAEQSILSYLTEKTKNNQTILIGSLDGEVPLKEQLKYYKRRYFGQTNILGEKTIKIEFVFVRCGGQDEWKNIEYTSNKTNGCWWTALYSIEKDCICQLKLQ